LAKIRALSPEDRAWLEACLGEIPPEQHRLFEGLAALDAGDEG